MTADCARTANAPGNRRRTEPRERCFSPDTGRGAGLKTYFIDTCVLPRGRLEEGKIYRETFGTGLGFELLAMFDLPEFEENLGKNSSMLAEGPLIFHEPVWGVEHAAPKGSAAYEESMRHIRLTKKWADILKPSLMVFHLNNGPVALEERGRALRCALENLAEIREMFAGVRVAVENTGISGEGTMLLGQEEFTRLLGEKDLEAVIDVGHANANGWDLERLIRDLRGRIAAYHLHNNDGAHDLHDRLRCGTIRFEELVPLMDSLTPEAVRVIEYTRPAYHGGPLTEDLRWLMSLSRE